MPLVLPPNFSPILNPCLRRPARVLRRRSPDGTGSVDSILAMLKIMDFLASFRNSWRCALLNSCFICTLVLSRPFPRPQLNRQVRFRRLIRATSRSPPQTGAWARELLIGQCG